MTPSRKCNWMRDPQEAAFNEHLVATIKHWRLQRGMSQAIAAKVCGVSRSAYCNLEAGRFRFSVYQVRELSRAFRVSAGTLFSTTMR